MSEQRFSRARRGKFWRSRTFTATVVAAAIAATLSSVPVGAQDHPAPAQQHVLAQQGDDNPFEPARTDNRPNETAETISDHVVAELAATASLAPESVTAGVEIHGDNLDRIQTIVVAFGGEVTGLSLIHI